MPSLIGVLLLASVCLIAAPAIAGNRPESPPGDSGTEDDRRRRDPWYGFGVGSWIIESETLKRDGEVTQTRREKTQRIEGSRPLGLDPNDIVLSVRREQDGEFADIARTQRHVPGSVPARMENARLVQTDTRTLEIDGRSYECEVKTWRMQAAPPGMELEYTLWYSPGLDIPYRELSTQGPDLAMPSDVLRAEAKIKAPNYTESASLQVKSINDELNVGSRMLKCVRQEGSLQTEARGRTFSGSIRTWLSKDVPGHQVRTAVEGTLGAARVERVREVLEFHVAMESEERN